MAYSVLVIKLTKLFATCFRELPVILKAAVMTAIARWKNLFQDHEYL
jgi:hypothetical protein